MLLLKNKNFKTIHWLFTKTVIALNRHASCNKHEKPSLIKPVN